MTKKSVTSLELRKLILKLCNEGKPLIRDILKPVGKFKSIIHSILRKLEETGSCVAKEPPGRPWKTPAWEDRWIGNEYKKRIDLRQQMLSRKELILTLAIEISRHTISQRHNEINLNSQVASMKAYISKRTKWTNWNLPLNMSDGLENSGIVFISTMSQSFTCSVVTGEGLFETFVRNDIHLCALKAALNLEEEVWWCLA